MSEKPTINNLLISVGASAEIAYTYYNTLISHGMGERPALALTKHYLNNLNRTKNNIKGGMRREQ